MSVIIHERDGISYIHNSDLTFEDQELFDIFNLTAVINDFSGIVMVHNHLSHLQGVSPQPSILIN